MNSDLFRHLAPIADAAWEAIDEEARETLKVYLAARKLVDFTGPKGWDFSAVNLGRARRVEEGVGGNVEAVLREVQPLVELRVPFQLRRDELESIGRGNPCPDLDPLTEAARRIAAAEDRMVFDGFEAGYVRGMHRHSEHEPIVLEDDYNAYPRSVAQAVERLHSAGVSGPYAVALGPRCYTGLTTTTTPAGYPVLEHVRRMVDGPIVFASALNGALVLSLRGGDFEIVVGRDLSIGYANHDAETISLYMQESLTFRLLGSDAAVPMVYDD